MSCALNYESQGKESQKLGIKPQTLNSHKFLRYIKIQKNISIRCFRTCHGCHTVQRTSKKFKALIAEINKVLQMSTSKHHGKSEFQAGMVNLIHSVLIISLQGTIHKKFCG